MKDPDIKYTSEGFPIHNDHNIKEYFDYLVNDPYDIGNHKRNAFIISLQQFYIDNKYLSPKQFDCLIKMYDADSWVIAQAHAYYEDREL